MFRNYKILLILSLTLSTSCDTMRSISSKYNILYNGDLFLNEGLDQLRNSYKDNFWDIIPVIVDKHNCCYSLSFKLSDLRVSLSDKRNLGSNPPWTGISIFFEM